MNNNEKAIATNDGSNKNLPNGLTMQIIPNNQTKINAAMYFSDTNQCSFCWRGLPNGSTRFNGVAACPRCYNIAHKFVADLQRHRMNYFTNFGGAK